MTSTASVFTFAEQENPGKRLAARLDARYSRATLHRFPDGESGVRIEPADVAPRCFILHTLHRPDHAGIPLLFLAETLRELGAEHVTLVAPYLAYMRQDKRFNPGEGVTARYYAGLLSRYFDGLVTVDPHLHRIRDLAEVYTIPARVVHAAPAVAAWIRDHVERPLLIGPDSESEQWIRDLADRIDAPWVVLEKRRRGDRQVEVSLPWVERWTRHTPVLYDDIISTARTMIETIGHLRRADLPPPVCAGVHGVFAGRAYEDLLDAGAARVVTTNTIEHASNAIDLTPDLAAAAGDGG